SRMDAVAGEISTAVTDGWGGGDWLRARVTEAGSAKLPETLCAITLKVPALLPAVYRPPASIDPPVAVQVTGTVTRDPSLRIPSAVKTCVCATVRVTESGEAVRPTNDAGVGVTTTIVVSLVR